MLEVVLLLLPVAAASGWMAAKRSVRRKKSGNREYDTAYFKGINYLLNEQPDKAIDVFIKMLEVDSDTVETHLALGNLFRRRGEMDRAIRIHQNLIARSTLKRDHRAQALLALGQDYLSAGLLDRAEGLFEELAESNLYQKEALRHLLIIYEQEREWQECLRVSSSLESLSGNPLPRERAHYYCELAEEAQSSGKFKLVSQYLKKAQASDSDCVRATMLLGQVEIERNAYKTALKILQRVGVQNPPYLSEIIPALIQCHQSLGSMDRLKEYLQQTVDQTSSLSAALALTDIIRAEEGMETAIAALSSYLEDNPSLAGLERLLTLHFKQAPCPVAETMDMLQRLIRQMVEEGTGYRCSSCGFEAKTMHWHCPSCHAWSSIKPVQT
jgi:lipopolysaccharide biosynthesis regulator YciM